MTIDQNGQLVTTVTWNYKKQCQLDNYTNIWYFWMKLIIMNRNTSISLGNYFDNFIQNRIATGRFNNASEVVRAGLRLLEEEENRIIALREAILEGINSGIDINFNSKSHLENLKAKKV